MPQITKVAKFFYDNKNDFQLIMYVVSQMVILFAWGFAPAIAGIVAVLSVVVWLSQVYCLRFCAHLSSFQVMKQSVFGLFFAVFMVVQAILVILVDRI